MGEVNQERINLKKERLQKYYDAEEKILNGQSYSIGSRSLTRANLSEVQKMITKLESEIASLTARTSTRKAIGIVLR